MPEYVEPAVEHPVGFFRVEPGEEVGGVVAVRVLVPDHQTPLHRSRHLRPQVRDVLLQILQRELLLEDVRLVRAGSQPRQRCQVTAVAAHGLDDEDAAFRGRSGHLHAVTRLMGSSGNQYLI